MPSRDQLISLVDQFLDAVVAHDPSRLPLAPGARYTENGQSIPFGKGIWRTASGRGQYTHAFADSGGEQVAAYAALEEMGNPVVTSLRLKATADGKISEAEMLVARAPNPLWGPENLTKPVDRFFDVVEPSERVSHDQLVDIANAYFDAIENDDGSKVPLSDGVYRLENGVQTTNNPERRGVVSHLSVKDGLSSGYYKYIEEIRDRRYPVVDVERGLVYGIIFFEHPGYLKTVTVKGVGEANLPPFTQHPSSAMIAELFKVKGGEITMIEAVLEFLPYGAKSGWD